MFSGDHVMGWSTTIVAPPDGAMSDYMNSLDKLGARKESALSARPWRRRSARRRASSPG